MQTTPPPTVRGLLGESVLRLIPRLTGRALDTAIDWVHSSDLTDPTPFLTGDTMLLTTGTQFPQEDDDEYYCAYVDRIVAAGVVALGFGLEVIREGTPAALVQACADRDVTLVEVPYEIPFIALIRWVADRISALERERDAWTLRAQRAVSVAALTTGTLPAVARALAEQVEGAVVILSSTGDLVLEELTVPVDLAPLHEEGRRILGRGSRASVDVDLPGWAGFATAQTLGPRGSLRGAMGVAGSGHNDIAMQAVVTSAVAIAEVLLRYGDSERHLEQRLGAVIVRLLLDGQVGGATAVSAEFQEELPEALRIGILVPSSELSPAARSRLIDALTRGRLAFVDDRGDQIVVLVEASATDRLTELVSSAPLFHGVAVGLSAVLVPVEAPAGLAQAARVLSQNPGPGVSVFGESAGGLLDDLWSPAAENLAKKRLAALADEPGDLVLCSRVWLAHNGHWESAAREAGLHRHTLKARVARVGVLLQLDLDEFAGRAELWALLEASHS